MKTALIDLPVLLIFFNRPDTFEKVFEQVKIARPSKLFLACDGARENNLDDEDSIRKCKNIASNIDWECEVFTNYSSKNLGCGVKPASSIEWALDIVDRIVILEDDCVPDQSFFPYMAKLLEKYKDDERIGIISGLNHFGEWDCGKYSYFFAKTGAIWGWGTWRRVWNNYDYSVESLADDYVKKIISQNIVLKRERKSKICSWLNISKSVKAGYSLSYWDIQFGYQKFYQNFLAVVPKYNLICNIGVGEKSTHAKKNKVKCWKKGMMHFIPVRSLPKKLVCPEFVICDCEYDDCVNRKLLFPNSFVRNFGRVRRWLAKMLKR